MAKIMTGIQHLGRTLMLPIAVLPVAGLLLRFGQPDLLDIPFVAAAGAAIFSNLGLLFAIGVAVGFAKENHGAAGLAGLVGYLVASHGAQTLIGVPAEVLDGLSEDALGLAEAAFREKEIGKLSVPIGIVSGIIAGSLYNRYGNIKLPEFLAFFGGRRFVPIAAGASGVIVAAIFGFGWPYIEGAMDVFSRAVVGAGEAGLFVYGVLNRLLIVTGLHHILNNVAWFILGDYNGTTGDLNRFFVGDKTAGAFMAGFFPVMMFGLPAACFAMYRSALPERRREVSGMYISLGLTSFLTGVTEPIEFTFIFLAPVLYAVHALLTGASMALLDFLDVKMGFGFSAGLIDYVLNFNKSTRPLLLIPVGIVYALIYYTLFRIVIVKLNLKTPGRDTVVETMAGERAVAEHNDKAQAFIEALGGVQNLKSVDACTTRLRLVVSSAEDINEAALKVLGSRGVIKLSDTALQVVLGPIADQVASEIKEGLRVPNTKIPSPELLNNGANEKAAHKTETLSARRFDDKEIRSFQDALGGAGNILSVNVVSSRLVFKLKDAASVDEQKLHNIGARGIARPKPNSLHLLLGPAAAHVGASLEVLIQD